MKVAIFSAKKYEQPFFESANEIHGFSLHWLEPRLAVETARLAEGCRAVSVFVHDVTYTDLGDLLRRSEIITLHCPLTLRLTTSSMKGRSAK